MRTKVAIVLHGLGANGIDTLFAKLADKWDLNKYEITYLIAVEEDAKQFWEDDVKKNNIRVVHMGDLDGKKLLKWPFVLYKNLKKYGPFDCIHVNMDMLNGINLTVATLAGIKTRICHAHVSANKKEVNYARGVLKKIYLIVMKLLIGAFSTERVACSELAGKHFYGNSQYRLVYNGIDIELYKNSVPDTNEFKQILKGETINFITVGRMSQQKNPLFLVEIIKELSKRKSNIILFWLGKGELEAEIKKQVTDLGINENILFLGTRSDVHKVLKCCDYFLLPSKYEGLSIALAEAQAVGLDCFVSDTVSTLSECGKCKFISLNKSASEWADEICEYIDTGKRMKIEYQKLAQFDISQVARTLEDLYSNGGSEK